MPDFSTLFAKIRCLPKRRVIEVDDFVDFLARRGGPRKAKPPLTLWEKMKAMEEANRRRAKRTDAPGRQC